MNSALPERDARPADAGPRYAIYFAPAETSELHAAGSRWLGYDAALRKSLKPVLPAGLGETEWHAATAEPARYGLHATLKPPFRLAPGRTEAALVARLAVFSAGRNAVEIGVPRLSRIGSFLALVPDRATAPLSALAGDCVMLFDDFRAPPTHGERLRRRAAGLTPAQNALLQRWGYPYVLEEFRFHVTLTGRLDPGARPRFEQALESALAPALGRPLTLDSLCLFVQPAPDARFHLQRRFVLGSCL